MNFEFLKFVNNFDNKTISKRAQHTFLTRSDKLSIPESSRGQQVWSKIIYADR